MDIMSDLVKKIDVVTVIKLAIIVVGVTQWVKSLFKKINIPTFVWAIFMSALAVGVVFAEAYCPIVNLILMVICLSQLGYEGIWQNIKELMDRAINGKKQQPGRY